MAGGRPKVRQKYFSLLIIENELQYKDAFGCSFHQGVGGWEGTIDRMAQKANEATKNKTDAV